tara:strand:+ start:1511 stop:2533 length:1023 start_codon:yes stop_codon:yes gene_type:complete
MTYFNKKEDVIQIKLTQYGKHLLSKGKFKPVYYAFYDDSVLYDSDYAGFTEVQSEIEPRIQEDTPALKVQHVAAGIETNFKKLTAPENFLSNYEKDLPYPQPVDDKYYLFSSPPLGTTYLSVDDAPAFKVFAIDGLMKTTTNEDTASHKILHIPQLHFDVEYKTSYGNEDTHSTIAEDYRGSIKLGGVYNDGSLIKVEQDQLLIQISEDNVPFSNEHFDVEVFLIEEDESELVNNPGFGKPKVKENLKLLKFVRPPEVIRDNLLLDPQEEQPVNVELDPNYIGYYFDLYVDHEIDPEVFCSVKRVDEIEDIFDDPIFECPDLADVSANSIERNHSIEECD